MSVLSYKTVLIFPYPEVKYHLECYMAVLKYLPLDTNSTESTNFP